MVGCPGSRSRTSVTDDEHLLERIRALVDEEHRLRGSSDGQSHPERLADLEARLDQCWDLLRQRRSRREFGEDPGQATARPVDVVEHYQQ